MTVELNRRFEEGLSCKLLDRDGHAHELAELVGSRASLLVFLRQFGCVGCALQIESLLRRQPEIADLGVGIVLIASGSPATIQPFVDRWNLDGRHLATVTDPSLRTFRAAGLVRSVWGTFGPRALFGELAAIDKGHLRRRRKGDALQQGGALLLDGEGVVQMIHANRFNGDCLSASDAVDATVRVALGLGVDRGTALARKGIV